MSLCVRDCRGARFQACFVSEQGILVGEGMIREGHLGRCLTCQNAASQSEAEGRVS